MKALRTIRHPIQHGIAPVLQSLTSVLRSLTQPYVVVNMKTMTRMGKPVLTSSATDGEFVSVFHTVEFSERPGQQDANGHAKPLNILFITETP